MGVGRGGEWALAPKVCPPYVRVRYNIGLVLTQIKRKQIN